MPRLNITTLNVLYHKYYVKYCKGGPVPLEERTEGFGKWVEEVLEGGVDVLALQEWPYGEEQGELWGRVLAEAAATHGYEVVRQGEGEGDGEEVPTQDGLLFAVRRERWEVEQVRTRRFARGRGSKRHSAAVLLERDTGVRVGVVNAHVPFGRDVRDSCSHVREMLSTADTGLTPHWVAVGDWNVEARRPADRFLMQQEGLPPSWVDHSQDIDATCAADRGPRKFDYVVTSPSVRAVRPVATHPGNVTVAVHHRPPPGHTALWFSDHIALTAQLELLSESG